MSEDGAVAQDDGRTGGPGPAGRPGASPPSQPSGPSQGGPSQGGPRLVAAAASRHVMTPAIVGGLLALLFLVLAVVLPDPSRHARGLLIVVDLVSVVGVAAAWIRVVRLVGVSVTGERVE